MSRKVSVCSAATSAADEELPRHAADAGQPLYPYAVALQVRVLQIVCGIGSVVVGAVGWLEERSGRALGLGVPAGTMAVLAASVSVYCSRGFGGWSTPGRGWRAPWRALGPTPRTALPLTVLWLLTLAAHFALVIQAIRVFLNLGCHSSTCAGVASAQLALSITELLTAGYMFQLDVRLDAT